MPDNETLSAKALGAHVALTAEEARRVINAMLAIIDKPGRDRAKVAAAKVLATYARLGLTAITTAAACEMSDIEEQLEQLEANARAVAEGDR
jgi:hypothetical protein